eukprot:gene6626-9097_t
MSNFINRNIEIAQDMGRTLLLIDKLENEPTQKYFLNSADFLVFDARAMHLKRTVRRQKVSLLLEEARQQLVFAMKYGKKFVIRLADTATDFMGIFNDEKCSDLILSDSRTGVKWCYFPLELFLNSGSLLRDYPLINSLYRPEDLVDLFDGAPFCHSEFAILITTTIPMSEIDRLLFNGKFGLSSKENFHIDLVNDDMFEEG